MDKYNDKIPDDVYEEQETKKNMVMERIKKAQPEVPKSPGKKGSKKKKNPAAPSPVARSPAAVSPVNKRKGKTITETAEEEISDRKFIKFIEQIAFIEKGTSLNTYYLTHLMNMVQTAKTSQAFYRNTIKNRNVDVFCIDETRVKLMDPNIEYYIHANHVKFERLTRTYIATQHPLTGTLNDFWAMIADQRVEVIVSLTNMNSKTDLTSFPYYFPNKPATFRNYGQFFVYCNTVTPPTTKYGSIEYKFDLVTQSNKEEKRSIRLYHYPHWAKNTVPASTKVVLDIVKRLGKRKTKTPIVVQCESGVNQSAELIYVDAMCNMLENGVETNFDAIFRQMRKQKLQSITQRLQFLHSIVTVLDFIKARYSPIPSALVSQLVSSISKDFKSQMSMEPVDDARPLKSP